MHTLEEVLEIVRRLRIEDRDRLEEWLRAPSVEEAAASYAADFPYMTLEEYFAFEERAMMKHEYVNGVVHAMCGVSAPHNLISINLTSLFREHLRGGPCKTFMTDFKLKLQINRKDVVYYPDVMVACGKEAFEHQFMCHPQLVVEVLSPSTQHIDRREKLLNYSQTESIEECLLVSQDAPSIELYRRRAGWQRERIGGEDTLHLESIGLSLPLAMVYEGVWAH